MMTKKSLIMALMTMASAHAVSAQPVSLKIKGISYCAPYKQEAFEAESTFEVKDDVGILTYGGVEFVAPAGGYPITQSTNQFIIGGPLAIRADDGTLNYSGQNITFVGSLKHRPDGSFKKGQGIVIIDQTNVNGCFARGTFKLVPQ
ncbi:hypothetical protein ABZN20_14995 [Methylococcus sp. ANG]|uniref:hypothetical protein n=1 Tax=Methylococcus sp. ANG TaxID=3231903 RepID=UPI0034581FB2